MSPLEFNVFCLMVAHLWEEKAMAPHSSTLAWKIPWTEEPDRLQSMGSQRVGHDWATSLSLLTFRHWRTKWQPTPVFLPGESQGWRSLVGCHLRGCTELDMTEATWQQQQQQHLWEETTGNAEVPGPDFELSRYTNFRTSVDLCQPIFSTDDKGIPSYT